jgi:maleate isomerase
MVKPTYRPGSLEDFIKLMPDWVGYIPLHVGIRKGSEKELSDAFSVYEERVGELASIGVDVALLLGAPPAMLHGFGSDEKMAKKLEAKYNFPVLTTTMAQVEAFRALRIKSLVGVTYFEKSLNEKFAKFFEDGGFKVVAMEGYPVSFAEAGRIPPQEIYAFAKKIFLKSGGADCIYMLGAGWRPLPIIELLERDLGTTIVASIPAQVWATQKRLHLRVPVDGMGKLLKEMPP